MNRQTEKDEAGILVVLAVIVVTALTAWSINLYDLTQCDFESDYKCEAIHGLGVVIPPLSLVTVWVDNDSQ